MKKCTIISVSLLLLLLLVQCSNQKSPEARAGLLDLSAWDLKQEKIINLKGEYLFVLDRFVQPGEFDYELLKQSNSTLKIPGRWMITRENSKKSINNVKATFFLKIILKEPYDEILIKTLQIGTHFDFYINGELQKVRDIHGGHGMYSRKIVYHPETNVLNIIIHASSYGDAFSNIFRPITLGTESAMFQTIMLSSGKELFIFGSQFILFLFCLFFLLIKKKPIFLYLALMVLMGILKALMEGEQIILLLFPGIAPALYYRLVYSATYSLALLFNLYFMCLMPFWMPKKRAVVLLCPSLIFVLIGICGTSEIITGALGYYHLYILLLFIYFYAGGFFLLQKNREKARYFFISFTIFLLFVLNDILNMYGILITGQYTYIGLEIFALFQIFMLVYLEPGPLKQDTTSAPPALESSDTLQPLLHSFGLSRREGEIAELLLQGKTYLEIGNTVFISINTVKFHIKNIFQKTGVKNRGELLHKVFNNPQR